ncbi:DUF7661 family protein [Vibrio campbellii]
MCSERSCLLNAKMGFGRFISIRKLQRPIRDFVVPPSLDEDELLTYLDDMYHEHASATHPCVFRVE